MSRAVRAGAGPVVRLAVVGLAVVRLAVARLAVARLAVARLAVAGLATAGVVMAGLALVAVEPGPTAAGAQTGGGGVTLSSQTPWVGAGGELDLNLRVSRPSGPSNLELAVSIYPAVATRSEFSVTLHDRPTASALANPVFPIGSLTPDASGDVTVPIRLQDPSLPRDSARITLGSADGVFPVRVELRERGVGRVVDRFMTHLVYLPNPHSGAKLGMALVLRVHGPPGPASAGTRPVRGLDDLASVIRALDATRGAPVTLAPNPETLSALASSQDDRAVSLMAALRRAAGERPVLSSTYVPVSLPALLAAGLDHDADGQMTRGPATVAEVLRVHPDARTWLVDDALDAASLTRLSSRGVERVVVSDAALEPSAQQKLTLTQPFLLRARTAHLDAVAADSGLAEHFDNRADPVLQANHLLADLAVIYLDRPGADGRAVVAVPPRSWTPSSPFLQTVLSGLAQSPVLEATSLESVFAGASPSRSEAAAPLVRAPLAGAARSLGDTTIALRSARRRVDGLATILGTAAVQGQLDERLLVAESSDLRSSRQRLPYVQAVERGVDANLRAIRIPAGRSITLTARRGEIPVTFQNRTGYPARVVVKVQSDKLLFPGGTSHPLDLARRNTTDRFSVVARTSGAFPMRITLESPDGILVIGRARLTVRSTAASGFSLAVSLGAVAFLAIWWGRHVLRGRRARRLVPT